MKPHRLFKPKVILTGRVSPELRDRLKKMVMVKGGTISKHVEVLLWLGIAAQERVLNSKDIHVD